MATGGFGTAAAPSQTNLVEQKLRAENVVKGGASWFLWLAGLSMVNSILSLSGSGFRFIFGLGIAQVVDALAHQAGNTGFVLDLVINGFVAAVFVLFWNFARKGQNWAFIVGMILYLLDGLFLCSSDCSRQQHRRMHRSCPDKPPPTRR
jgi:hypothetical protein